MSSLMRRYGVSNWLEVSAKNLSDLAKLERIFVALAQQMVDVRETIELTRSAKLARRSVIILPDDWELLSAPDYPVPKYVYQAQDQQLKGFGLRNKALRWGC